ncbi:hypothetical protein D3C76_1876520 [compost metagenome]
MTRGQLKADLDIGITIDLLYGPIFYRLLITGDELDKAFVKYLITSAFEGIKA